MKKGLVSLSSVTKNFMTDGKPFSVLRDVSMTVTPGEFIGIVGRSGSGKTTLLNIMSGIDLPSTGNVIVDGVSIHDFKQSDLDAWRGKAIGLVFQFFQLIPTLTVVENVMLPMDFCNIIPVKERLCRALELLDSVEMGDKATKFPSILSGGEKQRVAIARSMANDPPLILADEPTGNLDANSRSVIFGLFEKLNQQGKTLIIVSHDTALRHYVKRTIELADGHIINQALAGKAETYV